MAEKDEEEEKKKECPKCPPVGAPAWMLPCGYGNFANGIYLILSFAEFNVPNLSRFRSLRNSLVFKKAPTVDSPKAPL